MVTTNTDVAMVRKDTSAPMRRVLSNDLLEGRRRILHFGAGKPGNPDREALSEIADTVHYDPNFGPKDRSKLCNGDFDAVVSFFVLNILQPEHRDKPLKDMALSTSKGGEALIAVRSTHDVSYSAKRSKWKPHGTGFLVPVGKSRLHYQESYTPVSLKYELSWWFRDVDIEDMGWYYLSSCRRPYRTEPGRRKRSDRL